MAEVVTSHEPGVVDPYELAKQAAVAGHPQEAVEILSREAAQQRCGREKFQRRIQLSQICMGAGYFAIAYPVLQELYDEIEKRNLVEWESADVVAHALGLFYRCIEKMGGPDEQKKAIYSKLCRLDPVLALQFSR